MLRRFSTYGARATAVAFSVWLLSCGAADAAPRYVSPAGHDSRSCTVTKPCATVIRAAAAAKQHRSVVRLRGGQYGRLVVDAGGSAASPLRVRAAARARVSAGSVEITTSHVEIANIDAGANWYVRPGVTDVTIRNVTARKAFITSASDVRVLGGSLGPSTDNGSVQLKAAEGSSEPPRNILFDGVRFHDFTRTQEGQHVDCLHVMAADGLVLRNNRFWNCEAFDILFTTFGNAGSPRNVVIENNFFSCCRSGYYSVQLGGGHGETWQNFLIRNNSADKAMSVASDIVGSSNVRFVGNVGPAPPHGVCGRSGIAMDYNVWTSGSRCGNHDKNAASGFVNPGAIDFHLGNGAAAIGAGDPNDHPASDIDGDRRPQGAAPDAGADEVLSSAPSPPPKQKQPPATSPAPSEPDRPTSPGEPGTPGSAEGGSVPWLRVKRADRSPRWVARRLGFRPRGRSANRRFVAFGQAAAPYPKRIRLRLERRTGRSWRTISSRRTRVRATNGRFAAVLRPRAGRRHRVTAQGIPGRAVFR